MLIEVRRESLGGIGYLENEDPVLNIARLFRDANVTSIWEGTTDVMADDLIRVMKGADGPTVLRNAQLWVSSATNAPAGSYLQDIKSALATEFALWVRKVNGTSVPELKWMGRELLNELDYFVCGCLLFMDAASDGNDVVSEMARRWYWTAKAELERVSGWEEEAAWDSRIVAGKEFPTAKL